MPTVTVAIITAPTTATTSISSSPTRSLWDTDIHKSALSNDLERCQWLLTLDSSLLEARGFNGVLPAHCAARKGALPVLRFLAQRGADLKGHDNGRWTLLHHASAGGHTPVLEALLLGGLLPSTPPPFPAEDVDARAGDGSTPLLVAVAEGHLAAVRLLLRCGADPAAANGKGESALSHAAHFLAAQAKKAHVYEPLGRVKKAKATRDREAIAGLLHSSLYQVSVLRRLRVGAWGQEQQGQEQQGQGEEELELSSRGKEVAVLTALVRGTNDDVFGEALRYLKGGSEERGEVAED